MAKPFTSGNSTLPQETKKQRKKQAKQEAKLMLKIEQAQKDVQRAEQKVARAQTNLEKSRTYLSELQDKHAQMISPQELYPIAMAEASDQAQPETLEATSGSAQPGNGQTVEQGTSLPPVEGRSDVLPEDDASRKRPEKTSTTRRSSKHKDVQIESGGGSMPLETSDELAWPPPKIREELAEAIKDETDTPITERNTSASDDKS